MYELLADKDVDLSALGFGDNLVIEFDSRRCAVRISVFQEKHYQDSVVIDLKCVFCES